jgi:ABC-type sugar transport system permease subunit
LSKLALSGTVGGEMLAPQRRGLLRRRLLQRSPTRRQSVAAYAFMAPSLLILALFIFWPIASALQRSFQDYSILGGGHWIGLANYRHLLQDPAFSNALKNTLYYVGVTTPISVALALGAALLLNQTLPGRTFFRAAIFSPFVVSLAVVGIAWSFLLDPDIGLVTHWLAAVGIHTGNGIRDPRWAMPAVILVGIWKNVGFYMVMYLAGLQQIPRELQEAALVDGASSWQRFRTVTWPLLMNTTMFVVVIAAIFGFQAFDQIYVMTGGGPFFKTETLVMSVYRLGFQQFQMGYASAIAWVLALLVLMLSLTQAWFFGKRRVEY